MRGSRTVVAGAITLLAVGLSACGGSSSSSSSGGGSSSATSTSGVQSIPLKPGENPVGQQLTGKTKGGTLTELSNGDFLHLDPGEAYYALDYQIVQATDRPLFAYPPNSATTVRPDLATAMPTVANGGITDGGKTVTVHIIPGVHYSAPVNRAVTSKDVAFALERGANPNVGNAYWPAYFGAASPAPLVGSTDPKYKGGPIPGIKTPNPTTIVFHMEKPGAATLISALSLPLSSPLPSEFVAPLDKHAPTTYGTNYLVAVGPYMVQSDPKTGKISGIGYNPGKNETLVRNPNWNPKLDWRPAYLNEIKVNVGGDSTVIGQQVLKGSNQVQLDTVSQSSREAGLRAVPAADHVHAGLGHALPDARHATRRVQERQHPPCRLRGSGPRGDRQGARRLARRRAGDAFHLPGLDRLQPGRRRRWAPASMERRRQRQCRRGPQADEVGGLSEREVHRKRHGAGRLRLRRQRPGRSRRSSPTR